MRKLVIILFLCLELVRQILALTPGDLARVKFEQHPGQRISPDLVFRNENGRELTLGSLLGKRPVILVLGYDQRRIDQRTREFAIQRWR
jgi:hypothetical protein